MLQVHCWLEKVFSGDTVPPYEINPRTIDILYSLKELNEKQNRAAEIVIEDLQQKTDEYKEEGAFYFFLNENKLPEHEKHTKRL